MYSEHEKKNLSSIQHQKQPHKSTSQHYCSPPKGKPPPKGKIGKRGHVHNTKNKATIRRGWKENQTRKVQFFTHRTTVKQPSKKHNTTERETNGVGEKGKEGVAELNATCTRRFRWAWEPQGVGLMKRKAWELGDERGGWGKKREVWGEDNSLGREKKMWGGGFGDPEQFTHKNGQVEKKRRRGGGQGAGKRGGGEGVGCSAWGKKRVK